VEFLIDSNPDFIDNQNFISIKMIYMLPIIVKLLNFHFNLNDLSSQPILIKFIL